MTQSIFSTANQIHRRLDPSDKELLGPALVRVQLSLRQTLEYPDQDIEDVYFLEEGMASVVALPTGDLQTEVGLIGREGMTGTALVLGDARTPFECYIQLEGTALRISSEDFLKAFKQSPSMRQLFRLYARASAIQTAFTAFANAQFKLDERLARWLLMVRDRVGNDTFSVTHEFLSIMLGVRRSGVTDTIHILEGKGLIKSRRSEMTLLDKEVLKAFAGASYGQAEREYERLLH
jgi:CRP-like cAMP-binding protein